MSLTSVLSTTDLAWKDGTVTLAKFTAETDKLTLSSDGSTGVEVIGVKTSTTDPQSAVNKQYVDEKLGDLQWTTSCRIATDASVVLTDYVEGFFVQDITLMENDLLLIKNQADSTNGVYIVRADALPPIRAENMRLGSHAKYKAMFIEQGTFATSAWVCTNAVDDEVGTSILVFAPVCSRPRRRYVFKQQPGSREV